MELQLLKYFLISIALTIKLDFFDSKIKWNGLNIFGWKRKKDGHSGWDGQQPMRPFSQTYNMCYKNTEQKYHKRFSRLHPWKIASFKHYLRFPGKMRNFQKRSKRRFQKKIIRDCSWSEIGSKLIQIYLPDKCGKLCINIIKNNLHLMCFSKVTVNKSWHYQVKTN